MRAWIGITVGDPSGIGPEVVLKALPAFQKRGKQFLIFGDLALLHSLNECLRTGLRLAEFRDLDQEDQFVVLNPVNEALPQPLTPGSPAAAHAAIKYLRKGAELCLRQELQALVTAPVNKESIIRLGEPFIGQTELLSEIAGTSRTAMMLLGADERGRWLRVALVTTHLPLRNVADHITPEKIDLAIELADKACRDLKLRGARIAVCGLNPHAGEGGELGREEIELIAPAVTRAKGNGLNVQGPIAADTLFYHAFHGEYDAIVAMYHDQGLAPLKMVAFESGINWTLGLPFIRTSPDHGTAYNIAGRGIANPGSMISAIDLALQLIKS